MDHDNDALCEITADQVTIEVADQKTGKTVKRTLPLGYRENAHFLQLSGEDMAGKPSQIVFFSESGVGKLRDMTGRGPDTDPCGSHIN